MTRKTGGPWRVGLPGSLEKRAWRGCARSLGKQIAKSIGVRFVKDARPSLATPEGPQSARNGSSSNASGKRPSNRPDVHTFESAVSRAAASGRPSRMRFDTISSTGPRTARVSKTSTPFVLMTFSTHLQKSLPTP